MLSLSFYPKTTYLSSLKDCSNYYFKSTLLVGNNSYKDEKYISIFKFSDCFNLTNIEITNVSLNIKLLRNCNFSINEFYRKVRLREIVENFNIKEISWNNPPRSEPLNINDCDYKYDEKLNMISFNITSIFKNKYDSNMTLYGIEIICRSTFKDNLYKFYSCNSEKPPYIIVDYEKCTPISVSKVNNIFYEEDFVIQSLNSEFYSEAINIHNFNNATYFIKNLSNSTIYVYLQISPDGINFTNDVIESSIEKGESAALSLGKFLKFSRIKFVNQNINTLSNIHIWFQGQTFDYYIK